MQALTWPLGLFLSEQIFASIRFGAIPTLSGKGGKARWEDSVCACVRACTCVRLMWLREEGGERDQKEVRAAERVDTDICQQTLQLQSCKLKPAVCVTSGHPPSPNLQVSFVASSTLFRMSAATWGPACS